ncbi:MAG: diguanylate cyclase [Syntrophales bacterium]|nr:diguanylate cyclase [Syntrophales bacterium]
MFATHGMAQSRFYGLSPGAGRTVPPMKQNGTTKVMIVGAGELGTELFNTILDEPGVVLVGVVDPNDEFPGSDPAAARNIPVFTDLAEAMRTTPDLVFCLPESGVSAAEIMSVKPSHAEIVEHQATWFFLQMIHRCRLRTIREIRTPEKEAADTPTAASTSEPSAGETPVFPVTKEITTGQRRKGIHNILCIDPDPEFLRGLEDTLTGEGYNVICAQSGKDGLDKALADKRDLVILDMVVSDLGYFELLSTLKGDLDTTDVPIIILTGKEVSMGERLGLVGQIELLLHKDYFTREGLLKQIRYLEKPYPMRLGLLDVQSGLFDRSYLQIRLAQEIRRADRHQIIFSMLMAGIDHFNDFLRIGGEDNGDVCIKSIADFLRETTRGSDILVRYGTDEFAILLTDATEEDSFIVARRLLAFIANYQFAGLEQLEAGEKLSASIAVIHYDRISPCIPERMIFEAERLIGEAREEGGGIIKAYGYDHAPGIDMGSDDD